MSAENPIAKLGDLTKPATVLIEKISEAVGGVFKPYQIVRVAKAEAEANRLQAESLIQVTDLQRRAMHRFLDEEAKKQSNMEAITECALPILEDKSTPQDVADDWITNFFDKSRIVSDPEMQSLWSRMLAGEANSPGAFAKRTVNLLSDLDKEDATLFTRLCGFGWMIGNVCPLVYDLDNKIFSDADITYNSLSHLESLGLLHFNHLAGYRRLLLPKVLRVTYYGQRVTLTFPKESGNELELGVVRLTRAGQQLAPVCSPAPVDGYLQYVMAKWTAQALNAKLDVEPELSAPRHFPTP